MRVGGVRGAGSVRPQCPASAQFTAKQLEKLAKKAEKDSKAEQAKVKKVRPRLWLCWRLLSVWGALPATLAAAVPTGASSRPAVAPVCPPAPRECPEPKDRACLAFVSLTARAFYSLPKCRTCFLTSRVGGGLPATPAVTPSGCLPSAPGASGLRTWAAVRRRAGLAVSTLPRGRWEGSASSQAGLSSSR